MMTLVYLLVIVVLCLVMIKGTNLMMDAVRTLVISTEVPAYGIASFLLAFSTSLPELMVGISAGIQGNPELALGTILGSNIANITLVLGGAAVVSGLLQATDQFVTREVFYVFLAGSLPLVLLLDGSLNRLDGLILLIVYVIYNMTVLERRREKLAEHEVHEEVWWRRMLIKVKNTETDKNVGMIFLGAGLLIVAADLIVRLATQLATNMDIPVLLIGLFVVAIGTSLPELVFEIVAIRKHETAMAFGNIMGSVVTNSTLVLGITALLSEMKLTGGMQGYLVATVAFIVAFFIFWMLVWSKHQLERWEGALLVMCYVAFLAMELWRMNGEMLVALN